jgi:hypothetical protein
MQTRIAKMKFAFYTHKANVYNVRVLDIVKKIELFKVYVVTTGLYNCSTWVCKDELLMTLNAAARSLLMRMFGCTWKSRVSYDSLIKLVNRLGIRMFPMHIIVKMTRLTLFGKICRMNDSRILRQLLHGELAEGNRSVGRPYLSWIDCVKQDLVDFGLCVKSDFEDVSCFTNLRQLALDQADWTIRIKTYGMEYNLHNWYQENTARRTARMIKEGTEIITCYEPDEDLILQRDNPNYDKSFRYPLECLPLDYTKRKLERDLGLDVSEKLLIVLRRVDEKEKRKMNECEKWAPPYISSLVSDHAESKEKALKK